MGTEFIGDSLDKVNWDLDNDGLEAKAISRLLTHAGRHLQKQAGDRFWYEKDTQEACKLLFVRASDIRKEFGIIPPG